MNLTDIMQVKYEAKKEIIQSMFSDVICNEIQMAYEKTVLSPVPVGTDEEDISLESMKESALVILLYVNKVSDDDYDALVVFDLANEDMPLVDVVARNKTIEHWLVTMLSEDHKNDIVRNQLPKTDEHTYALKSLSSYLENNDLETHCIYKLPDLIDKSIYKIAYSN